MPTKSNSATEIFKCDDYRQFLAGRFQKMKAAKPKSVSLESVARKLGLSKSYFRYVIGGKRHLTLEMVPSFFKIFALSMAEKQALTYMILRDTSSHKDVKGFFSTLFNMLQDSESMLEQGQRKISVEQNRTLFSHWLAMVIHSLARQSNFRPDSKWIKSVLKNPSVTLKLIDATLKSLLESESIVKTQDGRWRPATFVFNQPQPNVLDGFDIYKVGMMAVLPAMSAPENYRPLNFNMLSLSFDENSIEKMRQLIFECRNSLIQTAQAVEDPTGVAFFNLNFATMASRE